MRTFMQTGSVALVCMVLGACNYYRPNTLQSATPPTPVDTKVTFQTVNETFIKPYCLRCHKGASPGGDVSLESYQAMIDADVLVPGRPDDSMVYTDARDGSMPKRPPMPSPELIEMFRTWIADGAIEN
jgi:hypothetical protein